MIEYIDKKYCKEDLIQINEETDQNIIISDSDILYLKSNDKILINKYLQNDKKYLFPFNTKNNNLTAKDFEGKQIYEYNKLYLIFGTNNIGYYFSYKYFFKGNSRAICLEEPIHIDQRDKELNTQYLDRKKLEEYFDSNQYDSMYIIYTGGTICYAKSLNDGIVKESIIIPSDEEIIEQEYRERKSRKKLAYSLINGKELSDDMIEKETIDNIKEYNIYGPCLALSSSYAHLFITSKDGKFTIKWIKLDYIGNHKFKLTTSDVFLPNINVEYLIEEIKQEYQIKINDLQEKLDKKETSISLNSLEKPKLLQRLFKSK